jgi:Raf kinase inhibitor-like YbhB/YbcL family protein
MSLQLMSRAFADDELIPDAYTCDGNDVSPPLRWTDAPAETKSFAVIAEDLDAPSGVFTHWLVYGLPANARELPEGVPQRPNLDGGARQGRNDFGTVGYGGPCPPSGSHRYVFTVYALADGLDLAPGATRQQFDDALDAHVVEEASLTGRYLRG